MRTVQCLGVGLIALACEEAQTIPDESATAGAGGSSGSAPASAKPSPPSDSSASNAAGSAGQEAVSPSVDASPLPDTAAPVLDASSPSDTPAPPGATGQVGAVGVAGPPAGTAGCSEPPFRECAEYEPTPFAVPADCSMPWLVSFEPPAFSTTEMTFEVTLACVDGLDTSPWRVTIMGYIPEQGIWDQFYSDMTDEGVLKTDGDTWTLRIVANSIDETTLADVDPCAGWMVGYESGLAGTEASFGIVANRTVPTTRPVAPVFEPSEIPLSLLCEPIPFAP